MQLVTQLEEDSLIKIGIHQSHYHYEYTKTLEKIFEGNKIIVMNDISLANDLDLDILFVNTIQNLPMDWVKFIGFNPDCKKVLTIHEINSELRHNPILKKFDAINVTYKPMRWYLRSHNIYSGPIFTLPYLLHEKKYPNKSDMYVFPGKIESFRRDYERTLEFLPRGEEVMILGEPMGKYGKKIIDKFSMNRRVHVSTERVPEEEYQKHLQDCKGIISVLKNPTRGVNRIVKEWYGKTKIFSAYFEAIKYGKELITNVAVSDINYLDYKKDKVQNYFNMIMERFL